ncbi:MAG: DUF2336 domain-containing protein [Alphaproteobacteria bacterium]
MDLNLLDRSSQVIPVLVKLHDTHTIYTLAQDKKPEAQAELSNVITELLSCGANEREAELIADILISLIRQAERELKLALSEKLAAIDNVPLRLALHIINEDIEIATPILKFSNVLSDLDLMYIIKSKSPEYAAAIAQRKALSPEIINTLAATKENNTVCKLLENMNIVLPTEALKICVDIAQNNEEMAIPLINRPDLTNEIASKLYVYVGNELKKKISARFEIPIDVILSTLDEVVLEFKEVAASEFTPTKSMMVAAKRHKEKGLLTLNSIISTLKRGQIQSFIAQFAVYFDKSPSLVEELLSYPKGNGLAILCRAAEITKSDFVSIFLLTNAVRQKGRMIDAVDMARAVNYYNAISSVVAQDMLHALMRKKRD